MTAPETKPAEPGTGVARLPKKSLTEMMMSSGDANARLLAYQTQSAIQRSKIIQETAVALAGTQWGMAVSPEARTAIAKWALEAEIDPVRHIYILGGKIYDNAELYIDKLASMPEFSHGEYTLLAPLDVRDFSKLNINPEQKAQLLKEQQALNTERLRLQMEWGVPANINEHAGTSAAALVELHFKDGTKASGVNWAGSRGRKKGREGKDADPVGDQEPVKTAITRAIRKAAKQKVPVWFKSGKFGARFEGVENVLEQGRVAERLTRGEPSSVQVDGADVTVDAGQGQSVDQEAGYGQAGETDERARTAAPDQGSQGVDPAAASPAQPAAEQGDAFEGVDPDRDVDLVCPKCDNKDSCATRFIRNGVGPDCSAGCGAKMLTVQANEDRLAAAGRQP